MILWKVITISVVLPLLGTSLQFVLQGAEPKGKVVEGKSIDWGDSKKKSKPPYQLDRVWVDYSDGVTIRVKYKRVATVQKMTLNLTGPAAQVYFVRGIKDAKGIPGFRGGSAQLASETRELRGDVWQYIGAKLVDAKTREDRGANALIVPLKRPNRDSGEFACPLIASEHIPLYGEGIAIVYLADFGRVKKQDSLSARTLSNAMVLPLKLPAKD
jgi:hypothetical protein